MSRWTRFKRFLCPSCVSDASERERPAVTILERTGVRLDRMLARMAEDDNPLIGKKPVRVPRRPEQ